MPQNQRRITRVIVALTAVVGLQVPDENPEELITKIHTAHKGDPDVHVVLSPPDTSRAVDALRQYGFCIIDVCSAGGQSSSYTSHLLLCQHYYLPQAVTDQPVACCSSACVTVP